MAVSKRFKLYDGPEITADVELTEEKTIEYGGHNYTYKIWRYTIFKDFYRLEVSGGPHKFSAMTACKKRSIRKRLKTIILSLQHK